MIQMIQIVYWMTNLHFPSLKTVKKEVTLIFLWTLWLSLSKNIHQQLLQIQDNASFTHSLKMLHHKVYLLTLPINIRIKSVYHSYLRNTEYLIINALILSTCALRSSILEGITKCMCHKIN